MGISIPEGAFFSLFSVLLAVFHSSQSSSRPHPGVVHYKDPKSGGYKAHFCGKLNSLCVNNSFIFPHF